MVRRVCYLFLALDSLWAPIAAWTDVERMLFLDPNLLPMSKGPKSSKFDPASCFFSYTGTSFHGCDQLNPAPEAISMYPDAPWHGSGYVQWVKNSRIHEEIRGKHSQHMEHHTKRFWEFDCLNPRHPVILPKVRCLDGMFWGVQSYQTSVSVALDV